ncbi:hypothetical protein HII31_02568 [Pseudocercospora fuligena]|uniref:Uncharacterized protein n=1 Tax=Pseudocercospora fuligena TaxID=685502 RepID=A0A8H6VMX3_9PEZI|nr:hypothetical protein HII31_02568 [Pseudocercospora fuligena]
MSGYRRRLPASMAKLDLEIEDYAYATVTGIVNQLSEDTYHCSVSFGAPYTNWRGYINVPKDKLPTGVREQWAKLQEDDTDKEPKMFNFQSPRPRGNAKFGSKILRETREEYVVALTVEIDGEDCQGQVMISKTDGEWKDIVKEAKANVAPECGLGAADDCLDGYEYTEGLKGAGGFEIIA